MPKKGDTKDCGGSYSSYLHQGALFFVCNRCGNVYPFRTYGRCGNQLLYIYESEEKGFNGPGWYVWFENKGYKLIEME